MSRELQRAVPKAIEKSLNKVAFDAMRALKRDIPSEVHTTNKFLQNSVAVNKATSSHLRSEVGIMNRVKFAELLVDGGERDPISSKYICIPVGAKGANGRAKRGKKPRDLLSKPREYFIRTIHGKKGIWGIWNGHISLMYLLVPKADYDNQPYINWKADVQRSAHTSNYQRIYMDELSRLLRIR